MRKHRRRPKPKSVHQVQGPGQPNERAFLKSPGFLRRVPVPGQKTPVENQVFPEVPRVVFLWLSDIAVESDGLRNVLEKRDCPGSVHNLGADFCSGNGFHPVMLHVLHKTSIDELDLGAGPFVRLGRSLRDQARNPGCSRLLGSSSGLGFLYADQRNVLDQGPSAPVRLLPENPFLPGGFPRNCLDQTHPETKLINR